MVQLLIAFALPLFCVPFVEEIKGGPLIVSLLLSIRVDLRRPCG